MYFSCTFKNRPRSERAKLYAEHKLRNVIRQFADQPVGLRIAFEPDGGKETVHLNLSSGRTFSTTLTGIGDGIYEAVDNLAAKLKTFLRRRKSRIKQHAPTVSKFDRAVLDMQQVDRINYEDDSIDAAEIISLEARRRMMSDHNQPRFGQ